VQADEQLTRLSEQLAKLERDDVRPPPAEPSPPPQPAQSSATPPPATPSPPAKPALAVPVGLMLAAGIVVVALVWQSSYGGGVRPSPQLASAPSLPPANPSAQPIPSTVQLASVEAVPPQDNAKAIGELKASQDEMKRALAKVPDQAPPRASSLPVPPATALRKPERPRSQVRARPRYPYPREWLYDDW
jgi:hypothetical protein